MPRDRGLGGGDVSFAFLLGSGESGVAVFEMFCQGFFERCMVLINVGAKGSERGYNFSFGRRTVEDAVEQSGNELALVFGFLGQFGDGVVGIGDGVAYSGSAEEGHDGAELHVAVALTFAGAFANGTSEIGEEAIGEFDTNVGQGGGAGPFWAAGESAGGACHGVAGIV